MKTYWIIVVSFLFNSLFVDYLIAGDTNPVSGQEIKYQAHKFFEQKNWDINLKISDNRRYFPCSSPLKFSPRFDDDWSAVKVHCESEQWSVTVRSDATIETFQNRSHSAIQNGYAVVLLKNVSKGELITADHVGLSEITSSSRFGTFSSKVEVIGRKAKYNLSRGVALKPRHLGINYDINNGDTVRLVSGNGAFEVAIEATALEDGQIGDMISVKNASSGKLLKVLITGIKKVKTITNM